MRILVTGANGYIGKNLVVRLQEEHGMEVFSFIRGQDDKTLIDMLDRAEAVVHLAGENRPNKVEKFEEVNKCLTENICYHLKRLNKKTPVLLASSIQAGQDSAYGRSKLAGELAVQELFNKNGNPVTIYRLPGVFGKWCKPNYNSVVATLCYNKARNLPVKINDKDYRLRLIYIDDLINIFIYQLKNTWHGLERQGLVPEYSITVGELSDQIDAFKNSRASLNVGRVGSGIGRAMYATYVSYLPVENFSYEVPEYCDKRGKFVEVLKTPDSGQVSFFSAHPGVKRGGHYHHTKTEKFLVVKGKARFGFKNIITNEVYFLVTDGEHPKIVETVPGWAHDITNIGDEEMFVVLWANEKYDLANPDTVVSSI